MTNELSNNNTNYDPQAEAAEAAALASAEYDAETNRLYGPDQQLADELELIALSIRKDGLRLGWPQDFIEERIAQKQAQARARC